MLRFPNKKSEDGHLFSWKGGYFDITSLELPEVMLLSGKVSRCSLIMVQGRVHVCVCMHSRNQILMVERWWWMSNERDTIIKCDLLPEAENWKSGW